MEFNGVIVFIVAISLLVAIHELGHLIVAKMFNVYCHEFAIGFGPKLFSKKGKETTYSLRAFPLGGFVAMAGEGENYEGMPDNIPFERTVKGIHPFKRILIMLAGIFMNIVLFVVFLMIIVGVQGVADTDNTTSTVGGVIEGYPAQKAGIQKDDKIVAVILNSRRIEVNSLNEINDAIGNTSGNYTYVVNRNNEELMFDITPQFDSASDRYLAGVQFIAPVKSVGFFENVQFTLAFGWQYFVAVLFAILNLFRGQGLENVGGPIAIMSMSNEVATQGIVSIMGFIAQLSMSLAVFNLIPIPVLDGGRVLLTLPELLTGKPLNKKTEELLIMASYILLLMFIVLIMIVDVGKFF